MISPHKFLIRIQTHIVLITIQSNNRNGAKGASLKIFQWNCQGARNKDTTIQSIAKEMVVICLQETLLSLHNFSLKILTSFKKTCLNPTLEALVY